MAKVEVGPRGTGPTVLAATDLKGRKETPDPAYPSVHKLLKGAQEK